MIVFGAGRDLKKYLEIYPLHKHIEIIIDSDIKKIGTNLCGINICSPDYLKKLRPNERIYISSSRYYDEISNYIKTSYPELVVLKVSDYIKLNSNSNPVSKITYHGASQEKKIYKEYADDYTRYDSIFWERYKALTFGLDSDSIDTVNIILKRLALILNSDKENYDIWSLKEIQELERIKEELIDKICSFDDNVYIYKEYKLPKRYFDNGIYYYYYYGIPMLNNLDRAFRGDVIDCGAFIGDSSLLFAKYTKKKVFAIEAQKNNLKYINETIRLNDVNNIIPINIGISDRAGVANIYGHNNSNLGTLNPYSSREYEGTEIINTETLDGIVEQYGIQPSFIKADIEGSETAMIKGAVQTLKQYKPTLILCIHHTSTDFWGIKPFIESMNLGYSFKIFKKPDGNILTGTWLIAEVN